MAIALALGALSLATRLPGFLRPWFDRDEAHIALQGQALLRGERLYTDVIDRKPPLVPAIYAAVQAVAGTDLRPVRVLLALWVAATAVVVVAIGRRIGASPAGAVTGGVLFVLGSVTFAPRDAQAANFELWAALFGAAAVLVALIGVDRQRPTWFAAAGALVGLAASMKQPFLATAVPVVVAGWMAFRRPGPAVGSLVATGATIALVGAPFGLPGMLRWAWTENGEYLSGQHGFWAIAARAFGSFLFFAIAHAPAVWLAWRHAMSRPIPVVAVIWVVVSVVALAGGLKFLGHYWQQALAPVCVLAARGADTLAARHRRAALAAAGVLAAAAMGVAVSPWAPTLTRVEGVVATIRDLTDPGDRILVWGAVPEIPLEARRPIAGGFVHKGFLTTMWAPTRPVPAQRWAEYLADVRADAPRLVVDTSTHGVGGFDRHPMRGTRLGRYVARHYDYVGRVGGMDLWSRR